MVAIGAVMTVAAIFGYEFLVRRAVKRADVIESDQGA
jgi:hypothetical protein